MKCMLIWDKMKLCSSQDKNEIGMCKSLLIVWIFTKIAGLIVWIFTKIHANSLKIQQLPLLLYVRTKIVGGIWFCRAGILYLEC